MRVCLLKKYDRGDSVMTVPALSVVMAAWNAQAHISRAIRSVLNQTWDDFEFVIVDDGSTDETVKVVRGFDDRRIRLLHNERNLGLASSLNRGIGVARANRISRLDADDEYLPDCLEVQMQFLDENPQVGIVGGWYSRIDEIGGTCLEMKTPETHAEALAELAAGSPCFGHSTIMFQIPAISAEVRYDEKLVAAQDYGLYADLFRYTKFANLQRIVANIYCSPGSISAMRSNLQAQNRIKVHQQVLRKLLGSEISDRFAEELTFTTDPYAQGRVKASSLAHFYDACARIQGPILRRFLRLRFRAMVRDKVNRIDIGARSSLRHPVGRMVLRYRVKGVFRQAREEK